MEIFSPEFGYKTKSGSVFKKYRSRTEMLLLEKEKTLLPQTQNIVYHHEQIDIIIWKHRDYAVTFLKLNDSYSNSNSNVIL